MGSRQRPLLPPWAVPVLKPPALPGDTYLTEIALDCSYPASSLKERVYASCQSGCQSWRDCDHRRYVALARTEAETHSILTLQGAWSFRLARSKRRPTARL